MKYLQVLFLGICWLAISAVSAKDDEIRLLPKEDKGLRTAAKILAENFETMSGRRFSITDAPFADSGVLLALAKDYKGEPRIPAKFADNFEAYAIHADSKSLTIVGNSANAVKWGIYAYLNKLGCRWFFPGKRWTIIPKREKIYLKTDIASAPDYANRNIWYQYGFGWGKRWNAKKIKKDYVKWREANRQGGRDANCGHSWGHIVHRNKAAFAAHPEYYAMGKDGKRIIPKNPNSSKFCCSNKELINLVAKDRLRKLEENKKKNPQAFMVSVDPSDGPFMCHCPECAKLGSGRPSDMVANLANGVAKYLKQRYPDAWVGFYAYSAHQYPPTLPMEKNVYVQIATAFNSTGISIDELIKRWGRKAGAIGIREYYSCMAWNKNLPGRARGANVKYLREVIPKWRKFGATSISAESSDNWAAQGLGYYVAANLMWDVNADVDALMDDFYDKCFGKAQKPIRELFAMWQGSPPLLPAYLAKWLSKLDEASKLTKDPAILARVNDLKAYMHYVVLYHDFESAKSGNDAREKYLKMMECAFRVKSRNILHSYALARRLANGRVPASVMKDLPEELRSKKKRSIPKWNVFAYKTCPWQQPPTEYTDDEVETFFADDLKQYLPYANTVKTYSTDLIVPPTPLEGADDGNGRFNSYRFKNVFYALFDDISMDVEFSGTRLSSLKLLNPRTGETLQKADVNPKETKTITLRVPKPGLYKIVANSWFKLKFPDTAKVVYEMSPKNHGQPTPYAGPGYFFVPKGTKSFHVRRGGRTIIKAPNGKTWKLLPNKNELIVKIDVPEDCDGKRWEICELTAGAFFFLDIPPYVSLTPNGYIGPKECFQTSTEKTKKD